MASLYVPRMKRKKAGNFVRSRRAGRPLYLGCFEQEADAALAHDRASIALLGEAAQLNYPWTVHDSDLPWLTNTPMGKVVQWLQQNPGAVRTPSWTGGLGVPLGSVGFQWGGGRGGRSPRRPWDPPPLFSSLLKGS